MSDKREARDAGLLLLLLQPHLRLEVCDLLLVPHFADALLPHALAAAAAAAAILDRAG
jgi:hypothetical protein